MLAVILFRIVKLISIYDPAQQKSIENENSEQLVVNSFSSELLYHVDSKEISQAFDAKGRKENIEPIY